MATSNKTYAAFDRAFASVSAFAISKGGRTVGRVAFKTGASVTVFLQLWGSAMTQGRASGGGYDRSTAAVETAAEKLGREEIPSDPRAAAERVRIIAALTDPKQDGRQWDHRLERMGYSITTIID